MGLIRCRYIMNGIKRKSEHWNKAQRGSDESNLGPPFGPAVQGLAHGTKTDEITYQASTKSKCD